MKFVLTNSGWIDENEFNTGFIQSDKTIYEVIRVIDGVGLFLEDHFDRLRNSVKLQNVDFQINFSTFKNNLSELISKNSCHTGNVKFILSDEHGEPRWAYLFIPYSYPSANEYEQGVATQFLFAERQTPNAKVIQSGLRERANAAITKFNLDEVLLVDNSGLITEGSRSNVFFVKSGVFYTAPGSMVLEGITRNKVIACIHSLGFELKEEAIHYSAIAEFDTAFLTGTSPKVLPVKSIGTAIFDVNNLYVEKLMASYNQKIQEYLDLRKL